MTDMAQTAAHARPKHSLGKWQARGAILAVTVIAAALTAASAAGSYDSLWHLAVAHNVPLPRISPVELDGALVGLNVIDIVLTACGYPLRWLRMIARLFGAGTVGANVAAGWPDPVGAFLRVFAPAVVVTITEAVRAVLLARYRDAAGVRGVPASRWLLAPWPTFILWRRMRLWNIRDYNQAVDMELARLNAIAQLEDYFAGHDWRQTAPRNLVWMLRAGVRMEDALKQVAALTAPPEPETPAAPEPVGETGTAATKQPRKKPGTAARNKRTAAAPEPVPDETVGLDAESRILDYIKSGKSASAAGRLAGCTPGYGRQVARKYKELQKDAPRDVVDGQDGE